jgi:hypothetical protein
MFICYANFRAAQSSKQLVDIAPMTTSEDDSGQQCLTTRAHSPPRFPTISNRIFPLASYAQENLNEERLQEIRGVQSQHLYQPQTARDKMRLMFEQKEAHRKENEEHDKSKKSKAAADKENTANAKKPRKTAPAKKTAK